MSGEDNRKSGIANGKAASSSGIRPFYRDGTRPASKDGGAVHDAVSGRSADGNTKPAGSKAKKAHRSSLKDAGSKKSNKNKSYKKADKASGDNGADADNGKKGGRRRSFWGAAAAVLLILAIGAACFGIYRLTLVNRIEVVGCERYTPTQIINAAGLYTGRCIFTYDMGEVKKSLSKDPYLDVVSAERVFPDELRITVKEREEFAAISAGNGTYCIIDREGYVLYTGKRDSIEGLLPVYGLGTFGFATGTYVDSDKSILRPYIMMELLNCIGDRASEIASIDVSIPASLKLATADGYTVMLGDSVEIPEKVDRMFAALEKARATAPAGSVIYINADSSDISPGNPVFTAAPTAAPTPEPSDEPVDTDAPEATEGSGN